MVEADTALVVAVVGPNPAVKTRPEECCPKEACPPHKAKSLHLSKETLQPSLAQKKPAPDKVENLAKQYLAELREG